MLVRTVVFAAVVLGLSAAPVAAQGWGTIKGKVVLDADKVPEPKLANVNKDEKHCLSKGPIYQNDLVVNKKNKGVRWALVWLTDPKNGNNADFVPSIHPSLKDFAKKKVEIDQPCCVFEPRVVGLMKGQTLVVKNTAPVAHNFKINAIGGPQENPVIGAGGSREMKGFLPNVIPTNYSCNFHPWMGGWIGTFAHPYFAVTNADGEFEIKNAPAGKFCLMVWHEGIGFVIINPKKPKTDRGKVIEVKAGGTTDVSAVKMKPPE